MKKFLHIIKENIFRIIAIGIITGIVIGIPALIGLLGIGIMRFLGIYYTSLWALLYFFLCFFVLEFPLSFITTNLPRVLCEKFHLISQNTSRIFQNLLSFLLSVCLIAILDSILDVIQISWYSIIGFSLFYTILDYFLNKKS